MSSRFERSAIASVLGVVAVGAFVLVLGWAMQHKSYDVWGGMLIAVALVLLTIPLAARVARQEADPRLAHLLVWALVLKLGASMVRYFVAFDVYKGVADADAYHDAGVELSELFRNGVYEADIGRVIGTGFVKILTGIVYSVIGPTRIGGFLVFAWLGFWGLYFFYRAFRTGVPQGDGFRYALLVFFLPSMLFWPSGIGKEAWMTLTLGLTAWGAARLLTRSPGGFVMLAVGLTGVIMVRPHMAVVALAGLVGAYAFRGSARTSVLGPVGKVVGFAVLALIGVVVLHQVQDYFNLERIDRSSVDEVFNQTQSQTSQGGSEFEAPTADSPFAMPRAVVSVMFRPFPWEAHNFQSLLAGVEGLILLGLCVASRHRLANIPHMLRRSPYVTFAVGYSLFFVYAFSTFGNFGIIARQRVQMFPFFLVLLALPPRSRERDATPAAPGLEQPATPGLRL